MRQRKAVSAPRYGSTLEQLEGRMLLSAAVVNALPVWNSVTIDSGVVKVIGTDGQDVASATEISGRLDIFLNGNIYSFSQNEVQKVYFDGLSGGDKFEMQRTSKIPLEAWGGIGRDTLVGGAGADELWGGKGGDVLIGYDGADLLRGALGDDRILGNGKVDTIYGGEGNDTINSGAGDDVIYDEIGTNAIDSGNALTVVPLSTVQFRSQAFLKNVSGYDPNQIRQAYNFGQYDPNAGAGQTIYLVNAFTGRDVLGDFQIFCQQFDLPMPVLGGNFEIVNASGRLPAVDAEWAGEINLDLQWARAVAPGAKIVLVQADSSLWPDISEAIAVAARMSENNGGGVVSMSLGTPQDDFYYPALDMIERTFRTSPNTTFIAASGDDGGIRSYPATSPYVTAVGGTSLFLDQDGSRNSEEIAWLDGGGGLTSNFVTPPYQQFPWQDMNGDGRLDPLPSRGVPDVSYNADPATGFAVYLTTPQGGDRGWFSVGGTSAGAPQWAGIVARINQSRVAAGQPIIGANLNGTLYQLYHDGVAYQDPDVEPGVITGGFDDIIVGNNRFEPATEGYDLATGIGVPDVSTLVAQLTRTDDFYFTGDFEFEGRFYLPLDTFPPDADTQPALPLAWAQTRKGTGLVSGGETVLLEFATEPNPWLDPAGESSADQYQVQLYRTRDGRIYGQGFALINNVNNVGPLSVTFVLNFEGTWFRGNDGEVHLDIEFEAVDPITNAELPESQFARSVFDSAYNGAWYGGTIKS